MGQANAPEKIYILPRKDYSDRRIMNAFTEKEDSEDIEYIRKDAFIKEAYAWINDNANKYWGTEFVDSGEMAEDFKKYMEE